MRSDGGKHILDSSPDSSVSTVTGASKPTTGACQARLIALDAGSDVYVAARSCVGKHLRQVPLMTSDRLPQIGKFVTNPDGPVTGRMRRRRNELYESRTTELKCRRNNSFLHGRLLGHIGGNVAECPPQLQERLGNFGIGKVTTTGTMEGRRQIKNAKTTSESSVDSVGTEDPTETS